MSGQEEEEQLLPIETNIRGSNIHYTRYYNITNDQKKKGIFFGIEKVESGMPHNLFIMDKHNGIKHDYQTDLVKFFNQIFGNSAWARDINLVATNGATQQLDDDQPQQRLFHLHEDEAGPLLVEQIPIQAEEGRNGILCYLHVENFLHNFPHQQPNRMIGHRAREAEI